MMTRQVKLVGWDGQGRTVSCVRILKLQFDPNQQHQIDAVAAVVDLFDGQPQGTPEYAVIHAEDYGSLFAGQARTELGVGNRLLLAEDKLHTNTRLIQARNDIGGNDLSAPLVEAPVLATLAQQGTRVIALRCAGFNNVDLAAAQRLGVTVVRVPAYSPCEAGQLEQPPGEYKRYPRGFGGNA